MARISQEEMDRRIARYGGAALVHAPSVRKVKVPNPNRGLGEGQDPLAPKDLDVDVQQWTGPGGVEIEAYQLPDDSWEVTKEQPATKPATSTAATRPPVPPGGSSETQGTPLPGGGWDNNRPRQVIKDANGNVIWSEELTGDDLTAWRNNQQANQPQTGEKREPVPNRPGWTSVTRTVTQGGNTRTETVYVGPDNREVPTLPAVPGPATLKPDGKGGTIAIQPMPDGSIRTTPLPGVPSEATSKYSEVRQDPTTGAWHGLTRDGRWEALPGGPGVKPEKPDIRPDGRGGWVRINPNGTVERADPSETPPPADTGPQMAPGMSPSQYLAARRQWYIEQRRAGTMKQAEVDAAWERDKDIATSSQNEATTAATQQNQRLATSMSGVNSALSEVGTLNRYLPVGSDLGGRALEAMLGLQYGQAQRMGGYGTQPQPLAVPPAPIEPDPSSQVAAIPAPPNALGFGVPGSITPAAAPAHPTLTSPEGQALIATNEANRQLSPTVRGAPAPPVRDDWRLGSGGMPPVAAIPESPFDFRARVATTPPWMMDEETWRKAREMGLEDQFWSVPRMGAA